MINWPPAYTIKRYRTAKTAKIRIATDGSVVFSLPWRMSEKHIGKILEQHKPWIIEKLSALTIKKSTALPEFINLPALAQRWQVVYCSCRTKLSIVVLGDELTILGDIEDAVRVKQKLVSYLKITAERALTRQLQALCTQYNFSYRRLSFRSQSSRWGSCSQHHDISLNYKLIFLPPALARHILLHELCHTRHFNHSAAFWQLLTSFDPDCHSHKQQLRRADQFLPEWL